MKGDQLYLRHILDAMVKIEDYIAVGREVFLSTSYWQDAVIRQLEIIGEATKRLSQDLRSRHHEISWRRIAGLRDVLIMITWALILQQYGKLRKGSCQS
jgi:uncharacterized protein with HEPN domain